MYVGGFFPLVKTVLVSGLGKIISVVLAGLMFYVVGLAHLSSPWTGWKF